MMRRIEITEEAASVLDGLVSSGRYVSASDAVLEGLRSLKRQGVEGDAWLRSEVVPVAQAMVADPDRGIGIDQVFRELAELHRERTA